jgi:tripartite-type tricarboxylate transporter receptor subunit TctC
LFAPAGTPTAVLDRLAEESMRVVRLPEITKRFNAQGSEPSPLEREAFAAFVRSEIEKWAKVVAATGMVAN